MAVKTETKKIDGADVSVTQFGGVAAFKIKAKLVKLVGPSLASIFKSVLDGTDQEMDGGLIGMAVETLGANLDSDEGFGLVMNLLELTSVDGMKIDNENKFNQVFAGGRMVLLYKILFYVVEVNYPDFFELLGNSAGSLASAVRNSLTSSQ